MRDGAPRRLAIASLVLAVAAGAVLATASRRGAAEERRAVAFQRAVHGLGEGTATSLADCAAAFDGSISDGCGRGFDPAPGGFAFCPHHAGPTLRR